MAVSAAQKRVTVYNFEVDGHHTYFVGELGAFVHNACGEIALGKDIAGGGLKALAEKTSSSWYRYWEKDGITRRTVQAHFGRAFHQAVDRAKHIHFTLDGIADPAAAVMSGARGFVLHNMTHAERRYIATNPKALAKTTFYRLGEIVDSPF